MDLYIKEQANKTAVLMTDNTALFTFNSLDEAIVACKDWYKLDISVDLDINSAPDHRSSSTHSSRKIALMSAG